VTPGFLDAQQTKWNEGCASGVPGHPGTEVVDAPYMPAHGRMFVRETSWER